MSRESLRETGSKRRTPHPMQHIHHGNNLRHGQQPRLTFTVEDDKHNAALTPASQQVRSPQNQGKGKRLE